MVSPALFQYDQQASIEVRYAGTRKADDYSIQNLTFETPFGYRRAAYLVTPKGKGPFAAALYVHWLETWAPNANRTQFLDEAQALAKRGVVSLLVETLWSDQDWFIKRTQADDRENSIRQVVELRKAMDFLLRQPGVDAKRLAYVGHDFGAMYGILTGSVDPRPCCYVLMAPTARFSDWYLYYPPIEENKQREAFIRSLADLDPVTNVPRLAPSSLLFQFGTQDHHVPEEAARELQEAAKKPKEVRWYEAGHELNEQAEADRMAWLAERLGLRAADGG